MRCDGGTGNHLVLYEVNDVLVDIVGGKGSCFLDLSAQLQYLKQTSLAIEQEQANKDQTEQENETPAKIEE